jgi:NCAIR mutase (PurE)-related protein
MSVLPARRPQGKIYRLPHISPRPSAERWHAFFAGVVALLGMLNTCAPSVSVVNIDDGFGAACIASLINHL